MQAAQVEEQANNFEGDLKVEREWRISLQDTMQQDRERISKLQTEIGQLKIIAQVRQDCVFLKTLLLVSKCLNICVEIWPTSRGLLHVKGPLLGTGAYVRGIGLSVARLQAPDFGLEGRNQQKSTRGFLGERQLG